MTFAFAPSARSRAQAIASLADLLERVDHSGRTPHPAQYRTLVARLQAAMAEPLPPTLLDAALDDYPAATAVYENLHYARSGLSRTPLWLSVESEQAARELLARVAQRPAAQGGG